MKSHKLPQVGWSLLILAFLGGAFLQLQTGCSSNNSPSSPAATPAPNTPTATSTPVLAILGLSVQHFYQYGGAPGYLYATEVDLQMGGQPVTNAAVTMSTIGVTLPIPYNASLTYLGQVYSAYDSSVSFTYVPGQSYLLSAKAFGQTAAVTVVAPGGNFNFSSDRNGAVTQVTWSYPGNQDFISVNCAAPVSQTLYANPTSGLSYNIPNLGVSNVYTAPGTLYNISVQVGNYSSSLPLGSAVFDYYNLTPVTVLDNVWNSPLAAYSYDTALGASYFFQIGLNVQGTAPTGAGVTLSDVTASHSVALPYNSNYMSGGVSFANYLYTGTGLAYLPGDTYVISTTGAAGTASTTLVAPGAVTAVDQDATTNAITLIGWQYAGTYSNSVSMNETSPSSVPYGITSATSPVNFPNTFYTGGTGSVYQAVLNLYSSTSTIANGVLSAGSPIELGETYTQSFTHN